MRYRDLNTLTSTSNTETDVETPDSCQEGSRYSDLKSSTRGATHFKREPLRTIPDGAQTYRSFPGEIAWRGIVARPRFAISDPGTLVVASSRLSPNSDAYSPLDALNSEITALIASQQPSLCSSRDVYAVILSEAGGGEVWCCDVDRILARVENHYFSRIRRTTDAVRSTPSSVVSFLIQQHELIRGDR